MSTREGSRAHRRAAAREFASRDERKAGLSIASRKAEVEETESVVVARVDDTGRVRSVQTSLAALADGPPVDLTAPLVECPDPRAAS